MLHPLLIIIRDDGYDMPATQSGGHVLSPQRDRTTDMWLVKPQKTLWRPMCFANPQETLIPGNDKVKRYETRSVSVPSTSLRSRVVVARRRGAKQDLFRCPRLHAGVGYYRRNRGEQNVAKTREHKCKKEKNINIQKNIYNSTKWAVSLSY